MLLLFRSKLNPTEKINRASRLAARGGRDRKVFGALKKVLKNSRYSKTALITMLHLTESVFIIITNYW